MGVERCGNCRFHKPEAGVVNDSGDCHRYAPRPMVGAVEPLRYVDWPKLPPEDWCGEWQAMKGAGAGSAAT